MFSKNSSKHFITLTLRFNWYYNVHVQVYYEYMYMYNVHLTVHNMYMYTFFTSFKFLTDSLSSDAGSWDIGVDVGSCSEGSIRERSLGLTIMDN